MVNTDFRFVFSYLRLQDSDEENEDKISLGLSMFFGPIYYEDIQGLAEWLKWYMDCGKSEEELPSSGPPVFDLLQDCGLIYAAFMQAYHVNLRKVKMHWWIFSELLRGLPTGTGLSGIMELRGRKVEDWMKPEQKMELIAAQLRVRIRKGEMIEE